MAKRALPVIPPELHDPKLPRGIFSPSQYSSYKRCARAYEFHYLQNLSAPPAALMVKGTSVHAGAELAHLYKKETGGIVSLDQARQKVADTFQAETSTDEAKLIDWEDQKPGEVKDEAIQLYTCYHREGLPNVHPLEVEHEVLGKIGTVPVLGYIDLIDHVREKVASTALQDPGVITIADMKTSSTSWSDDDIKRDPQFTAYAVLKGIPTVRVDNLVQLKKGPKLNQKTAIRTRQDQAVLVEDYEATVDLIKRGIFPMTSIDNWACSKRWCGFWDRCRGRKW